MQDAIPGENWVKGSGILVLLLTKSSQNKKFFKVKQANTSITGHRKHSTDGILVIPALMFATQ